MHVLAIVPASCIVIGPPLVRSGASSLRPGGYTSATDRFLVNTSAQLGGSDHAVATLVRAPRKDRPWRTNGHGDLAIDVGDSTIDVCVLAVDVWEACVERASEAAASACLGRLAGRL
jgi:hypothetical protein